MEHAFFYVAVTLMLMHEVDAVRCKEWRFLPGIGENDRLGYLIVQILHLPMFFFLVWSLYLPDQEQVRYFLNWFFIIHFPIHLLFSFLPQNGFKDWISWSIIIGAALFSGLDLLF